MEEGTVIAIDGNEAVIAVEPSKNCGGCKACCTLSQDNGMMISRIPLVENLKKGDVVKFEITEEQQLAASAALYLIPLAFAFIGYFIGVFVIAKIITFDSQAMGIIGAFIAFVASFFLVASIEKNQQHYFVPKVVKKS